MDDPTLAAPRLYPNPPFQAPGPSPDPTVYEIVIRGHLDEDWSTWLGGMALYHNREGYTRLRGAIPDQAALFGILLQLRDLGLTLISLQRVPLLQPANGSDGSNPP